MLQLDTDLENLKCIYEEKYETLKSIKRGVQKQDKKLDRAKAIVDRARAEFKESSPGSATDYEIDMNIRIQKEKQRGALIKLRDLCAYDEEFSFALDDAIQNLKVDIPEASRLLATPGTTGGRSSTSSGKRGSTPAGVKTIGSVKSPESGASQQWQMSFEPPSNN